MKFITSTTHVWMFVSEKNAIIWNKVERKVYWNRACRGHGLAPKLITLFAY